MQQRLCQTRTLAFATGQLTQIGGGMSLQFQLLQQGRSARLWLLAVTAGSGMCAEQDIVEGAAPEHAVILLQQNRAQTRPLQRAKGRERLALQQDLSGAGGLQSGQGANEGGFANAIGAEQTVHLAGLQRQIGLLQQRACTKTQTQLIGTQHRRQSRHRRESRHQRLRPSNHNSSGTPSKAVATPTGISIGAAIRRARQSASSSRLPPSTVASGSNWRWA